MEILTLSVAIASAVMAGTFFAFSSFIMTALGNLQPAEGIRAMQRINIDVFCGSFVALFFGLPIVSASLGVYGIWRSVHPYSVYWVGAGVVYVAGSFLVTAFGNVPLNEALARVDPDSKEGSEVWRSYLVRWTRWNHVRALACLIAALLLTLGLLANTN